MDSPFSDFLYFLEAKVLIFIINPYNPHLPKGQNKSRTPEIQTLSGLFLINKHYLCRNFLDIFKDKYQTNDN